MTKPINPQLWKRVKEMVGSFSMHRAPDILLEEGPGMISALVAEVERLQAQLEGVNDLVVATVPIGAAVNSYSQKEVVNHPSHYGGDTPYEVIKVMVAWYGPTETAVFCKLNAVKYLARAGKKGVAAEDHAKAAWYARQAKALLETGELASS